MRKLMLANILRFGMILTLVSVFPLSGKANLQDEYNKKKAIQDNINQNEKEKKTQKSVLERLKFETTKLENQIVSTEKTIKDILNKINQTNRTISEITGSINLQIDQLNAEKDKLQDIFNHMYISGAESNPALVLVESESISKAVADMQSFQALEIEIDDRAKHIEALNVELEKNRADAEKEKLGLLTLQDQVSAQKRALDGQKALKIELAKSTTQSIVDLEETISKYKSDLKAVDGRISEFLAAIKLSDGYVAADGDFIVANSSPWHLYQTDPRWASQKLDPNTDSSDSFAESGCLVTSVTMVANSWGIAVSPLQTLSSLRASGGMYGDLLAWGGVSGAFDDKLEFVAGSKELFNAILLDNALDHGRPVIVHIKQGVYGHWVVVSAKVGGKYVVDDPYFQTGRVYPAAWIDYMARLQPSD